MNEWVHNKLRSWNLGHLIPEFEAQDINEESFSYLDEELIKQIIPKTGPRAIFLKHGKSEHKHIPGQTHTDLGKNVMTMPVDVLDWSNAAASGSSKELVIMELDASSNLLPIVSENQAPVAKNNFAVIDEADITVELCEPIRDLVKTLRQSVTGVSLLQYYKSKRNFKDTHRIMLADAILCVEMRTTPELIVKPERLQQLADLIVTVFPTESTVYYYVPYCYDPNTFAVIDEADITVELCEPIRDLVKTLRQSVTGVSLLQYYKSKRNFKDTHRIMLADAILCVEMRTTPELIVKPERLQQLADLIVTVFPTESTVYYYVPYCYDPNTSIKNTAKGKLHQRQGHFRALLLESGIVRSARGVKRKALIPNAVHLGFHDNLFTEELLVEVEDYEEKINWLQNNVDPHETVLKYWADTALGRMRNLIIDQTFTSSNYFTFFPALRHPGNGLTLIDIDFNTAYPEKARKLFDDYQSFEKQILTYCNNQKRQDGKVKELLALLNDKENLTEEVRSTVVFQILPLLLKCPPCSHGKNKNNFKPQKSDVQSEFLLYAQDEIDLTYKLQRRKEQHLERGLFVQPLPVIVGKTLKTIEKFYVVINDIKFEATSTLDVIDKAFKSCFSLQLNFSQIALYPWLVLQNRIYDIKGETDGTPRPVISSFINDLIRSA